MHGLIETSVLDGDGNLRGERGQHALVLFIKKVGTRVLEIEHADDSAFVKEWDNQLRPGLGVHGQVPRVLGDVVNIDGTPLADGGADDAAGDGNAANGRVDIAEAPCVAGDEALAFFIEQHDGEHLIVDEAAEKLAYALEKGIEIED